MAYFFQIGRINRVLPQLIGNVVRRSVAVMDARQKLQMLQQIAMRMTLHGTVLCGPTENGYYWSCENHVTAKRFLERLLREVEKTGIDPSRFRHRFQPANGAMLIIEPVGDDVSESINLQKTSQKY